MTTITTTAAPARTDVTQSLSTGMSRESIRRHGLVLAGGAAVWAAANLVWGFTPTTELGWKVTDLGGLAFQVGVMALLQVQIGTRATGVRPLSRRLLQTERVILAVAMLWSVAHALLPGQRDSAWMGVLDAFWPLSMLGMFLIGVKIAVAGRFRGRARVWSFLAETWAVVCVPVFGIFGGTIADVVGAAHLLLGYTVLGLILCTRPDLVEDRG